MHLRRFAPALGAAFVAACATEALQPDGVTAVTGFIVPQFEMHEECTRLEPGDRVHFSFSSNEPVDFNIHYHDAGAIVMPLTRDKVREHSGVFAPPLAQDYCFTWESGAAGARLDYRIDVRRGES